MIENLRAQGKLKHGKFDNEIKQISFSDKRKIKIYKYSTNTEYGKGWEDYRYEGEMTMEGIACGQGVATGLDNSKYVGTFFNGKPEGIGK